MSNQILAIQKLYSEAKAHGSSLHNRAALVVPRLNQWFTSVHNNRLRISGQVCFHPDYPDGATITTSGIKNHLSIEGRLLVSTKNSVYELGEPLNTDPMTAKKETPAAVSHPGIKTLPDPWSDDETFDNTALRYTQA